MTAFFFILTFITATIFFYWATSKNTSLLLVYLGWQICVGCISFTGFFVTYPIVFPFTLVGTVGMVYYLFQKLDTSKTKASYWLALCALRLPVELILYRLALEKKIPTLMTFEGWNFDIIIGISAGLILLYKSIQTKPITPFLFRLWNLAGLSFIFIIVGLAILSSPLPIQQIAFDQPNIAVLYFPYSLLPSGIVSLAVLSHLMLLKKQ